MPDLIVDADAHVVETERTWDFMDASEKKYRPVALTAPESDGAKQQFWMIDGRVRGLRFAIFTPEVLAKQAERTGRAFASLDEAREVGNVDIRLQEMDRCGVDIQVLHNTIFIEPVTDRAPVEVALYKSWNRWLADISDRGGGRLHWSCMAPTSSIPDALDNIRFSHQHGACAVLMRPVEGSRLLCDTYFYPIYELASQLNMAIAIHIANGSAWLNDLYRHPVFSAGSLHRFRVPTVASFNDVLLSEIPEVFPKLRWGFIEASAQWLPWALHEARSRFKVMGREWSDNVARDYNMFVTCENSDDLPYVVANGGKDSLVIGTDYGHNDTSSDVNAIKVFQARTDVDDDVKHRVLCDNPRALYGL